MHYYFFRPKQRSFGIQNYKIEMTSRALNDFSNSLQEKFGTKFSDRCVYVLKEVNGDINEQCAPAIQYASERSWGTEEVLRSLASANGIEGFDWNSVPRGDWSKELLKYGIWNRERFNQFENDNEVAAQLAMAHIRKLYQ